METDKLQEKVILEKAREILKNEGWQENSKPEMEKIIKDYLLPALQELKEIQSPLYEQFYQNSGSTVKKFKNKFINKIANITRNTVELSLMKQQKFNDNMTLIVTYLLEQNLKLKEEVNSLKKNK